MRAFSAIPSLNDNGVHTGGISGFLKSLGYAIKLNKPDRCIIIFDGPGGSAKRRRIFPEYKANRKTKVRLNRIYEDNHTDLAEEEKNMKKQIQRVVMYLQYLPVKMISLDNVEADDTIAFISSYLKDNNITIMSSDKDFLQLVSERVNVWSPSKKKLYAIQDVINEYKIHPYNFVMYRALDGDKSDNIPGIKGCGIKTAIKAFPFLCEGKKITTQDIYDHCEDNVGKLKIYETILKDKSSLDRNYELMQLHDTQLPSHSQLHVMKILDNKVPKLNRLEFSKLITEDRMWNGIPNYQIWLNEVFGKLK